MTMFPILPKKTKFLTAVVIQLLIVFGLVVFNASLLVRGQEIILPIEPVDPRDPLRGDYMTVQYDISSIEISRAEIKQKGFAKKDIIYAVLKKNGNYWILDTIEKNKPAGGVFIKGNIEYISNRYYDSTKKDDQKKETVRAVYGIENYFIPEGSGGQISAKLRDYPSFARVVIANNGTAILKEIFFGEK